jgi:hypothetical protein
VGLIVEMPNPITEVRELYLLEVTQNPDKMIDVFFQAPRNGFSFFKLFERIHHYCGSAIWWCSLQVCLLKLLMIIISFYLVFDFANLDGLFYLLSLFRSDC